MSDEQTDQEQTQQIGELTERLARLELALAESPVTAVAVRDLFPAVEPLAVPPDVADGQVITAAYINAIKASINTWQANVSGNGYVLGGVLQYSTASQSLGAAVGSRIDSVILLGNTPNADHLRTSLVRYKSSAGDWSDAAWYMHRIIDGVVVSGEISFPQNGLRLSSSGSVIGIELQSTNVLMPNLRSTNPGAGSRQLWYDPADGNRVKFAP